MNSCSACAVNVCMSSGLGRHNIGESNHSYPQLKRRVYRACILQVDGVRVSLPISSALKTCKTKAQANEHFKGSSGNGLLGCIISECLYVYTKDCILHPLRRYK